jgi:hypothetical protein
MTQALFSIFLSWIVGSKVRPEVERAMLEMDDMGDE